MIQVYLVRTRSNIGESATPSSFTGLTASFKGQTTRKMSASVDYPFQSRLELESIRVFLRRYGYEAYCREIKAHAVQAAGGDSTTEKTGCPVGIVFSVDVDQLEFAVECGMILDCTSVETLTEASLRPFLDGEAQELQTTMTESDLTKVIETAVKMDIRVNSAMGRLKLLFIEYKSLQEPMDSSRLLKRLQR